MGELVGNPKAITEAINSTNAAISSANTAIANMNPAKTTRLTDDNVTSDTFILSLANGNYMVAGSSAITSYIPERYGTLVVNNSGDNYGTYTFVGTSGKTYTRHKANISTWHTEWKELALKSELGGMVVTNFGSQTLPVTVDVPNNSRSVFILTGPYTNRANAIIFCPVNNSGGTYPTLIGGIGTAVASSANNKLTISDTTSASTTAGHLIALTFYGSVPSISTT